LAGKDKVRIGLIGCGKVSRHHIQRLLSIPKAEIVALSDIQESKIRTLQEKFPELSHCQTFIDYQDMMRSVDLDGVEVLTPHTLHFRHVMDALDAGLHVLVEKPMVTSTSDAIRVVDKSKEENRVVLVSYQRRYQSEFRYIKKIISSEELGDIQFISAFQDQGWLRMHAVDRRWRLDPRMSGGGQLMDSGSHLLDMILWITGLSPTEVFAFIERFDVPVDVNSTLSVRFSNGAQAGISIVGNSPCKGMREEIAIWGTNGLVFCRKEKKKYELARFSFKGEKYEPIELPPQSSPDLNFINAILGLEDNLSPPEESVKVIKLVEAAWESAKTGRKINM